MINKKVYLLLALVLSFLLITGCSGSNNSAQSEEPTNSNSEEVVEDETEETVTTSFDEDAIKKQIKLTELGSYTQPYSNGNYCGYAAVAKNESDKDIVLNSTVVFYDDNGDPIATSDSSEVYVNAGGSTLLFADAEMDDYAKAEMELFVEEPDYEILSSKLETKSTLKSENLIIQMTNTSEKDADFACALCAFFDGDKLIDCQPCYCINNDDILEAGNMRVGDVSWIGDRKVDKVRIFPSAEATDQE